MNQAFGGCSIHFFERRNRMKIAKLHKPQRMGNWKNVLAYSSEEDEENPDALAAAEAAANADSTSTDSTAVITSSGEPTERGWTQTLTGDLGDRITFELSSPIWIDAANDSTQVDTLRVNFSGPGASIDIAIPLPGGGPTPPPQDSGYCPQCLPH